MSDSWYDTPLWVDDEAVVRMVNAGFLFRFAGLNRIGSVRPHRIYIGHNSIQWAEELLGIHGERDYTV